MRLRDAVCIEVRAAEIAAQMLHDMRHDLTVADKLVPMTKKTSAQLDREIAEVLAERVYPMAPRDSWYSDADYEARGGKIVMMSPTAFLSKVRPLKIDEDSRDNIDDLKDMILKERPLDPLKIYADGKEDGRHRAHAAKELGIKKVPVVVWPHGERFTRS